MKTLKENIKAIAVEQGKTEIEVITDLQAAAAATDNTELLDDLCEIKSEILGI